MLALALSALFETAIVVIGVIVLYQVFVSGFVKRKLAAYRERRERLSSSEKIARLKLISDDPKDIEAFIYKNAAYISDEMAKLLVNRIEYLKADIFIKKEEELESSRKRVTVPDVVEVSVDQVVQEQRNVR